MAAQMLSQPTAQLIYRQTNQDNYPGVILGSLPKIANQLISVEGKSFKLTTFYFLESVIFMRLDQLIPGLLYMAAKRDNRLVCQVAFQASQQKMVVCTGMGIRFKRSIIPITNNSTCWLLDQNSFVATLRKYCDFYEWITLMNAQWISARDFAGSTL